MKRKNLGLTFPHPIQQDLLSISQGQKPFLDPRMALEGTHGGGSLSLFCRLVCNLKTQHTLMLFCFNREQAPLLQRNHLAKCKIEHSIRFSATNVIPWELSPPSRLKLNVDTICFFDHGFIGIGAIIRDATGMVCTAMSKSINGLSEPLTAKLLALREGIHFALH
ncbi:hypothetical protein PanWU01x14_298490 [Parasponia andersonii]|uniref:RNase H type-1 domain-containing protein n=1 Tax=Parasponia andersonii TaxID=3476 RepID=A0A2P5AUP8_PARAD|nr:hypothetical protein PanWU01x14_298490 [Parasponia andersonii]